MHKLSPPAQEGWAIHIYSRDRHLLCTLDPSHCWTFIAGLALGLTVAVVGYPRCLMRRNTGGEL